MFALCSLLLPCFIAASLQKSIFSAFPRGSSAFVFLLQHPGDGTKAGIPEGGTDLRNVPHLVRFGAEFHLLLGILKYPLACDCILRFMLIIRAYCFNPSTIVRQLIHPQALYKGLCLFRRPLHGGCAAVVEGGPAGAHPGVTTPHFLDKWPQHPGALGPP